MVLGSQEIIIHGGISCASKKNFRIILLKIDVFFWRITHIITHLKKLCSKINVLYLKQVNRLTRSIPSAPKDAFLNDYAERNTTNVVLSHMPLLFLRGSFVQNVTQLI